jgi:valine--pyruvate aminotransferase
MMGGGNPAHIPAVTEKLKQVMQNIVTNNAEFERFVGIYAPPQGPPDYLESLAKLLSSEYGWPITSENIALTNGSQSAFFMLFNLLAGENSQGDKRYIHFPLIPEYIGYADGGLDEDFFRSTAPSIEHIDDHTFKYHIDFNELAQAQNVGAFCVSRPTNPTGNVITDIELNRLYELAKSKDVPLIIDGAYGLPFPGLVFTDAKPLWNNNIILCLSLSKLGLPAARTGIVIAEPALIKKLSSINAIMSLATGNMGAMLTHDWVSSGEILSLSNKVISPWYQHRALEAEKLLRAGLDGLPYALHKVEGAMFLWLWMKDLPITSQQLYEQLKSLGVLIVSGHHFFPGLDKSAVSDDFLAHRHQCIRITYSQDEDKVKKGLSILAEALRDIYSNG